MGVGKTTLGKIVSKKLKLNFIDTDKAIEEANSMKINEIFNIKGEPYFRQEEEREVLKSLKMDNSVIALGGGAFINENIRNNILKHSKSVWLDCSLKTLNERIKQNKNRPLLNNQETQSTINKIYEQRKDIYKLANFKINCDNVSKEDIIKKIIDLYEKQ